MVNQPTDDISDVRPSGVNDNATVSPTQIPIRGEKRIIPTPINAGTMSTQFESAYTAGRQKSPGDRGYAPGSARTALVEQSDFYVAAAMEPFIDYVIIRLQNRGSTSASQQTSNNAPAVYRFLINPAQVQISRTTLDAQAMTRAGWQIGVWGEDSVSINLNGKTAGQYFAFGITDKYQQFAESYRNLEQLQMVFENNGYWFEGESVAEGPLAADFTRRRIKMHADVELIVGNFVWYGMFDTLTITQSADEPWLASFNLNFIAWVERFRSGSPYQNQISNHTQRGHSYAAWASSPLSTSAGIPPSAATPVQPLPPTQPIPVPAQASAKVVPPAIQVETQNALLPNLDTTTLDSSPIMDTVYSTGLFAPGGVI